MQLRALMVGLALAVGLFGADEDAIFPRRSPLARITQAIGTTEVSVEYHRPQVRGRKIWGDLVPFGQVWRMGANEATTVRFSDSVKIDGHPLPAGLYALFAIPEGDQWTIIFNRRPKQWGAYETRAQDDVLRIYRKPRQMREHEEWLSFSFIPSSGSSAYLSMRWEKLEVSFLVEVDVETMVNARMKRYLAQAKTPKAYAEAAEYMVEHERELPTALDYIDRALKSKEDPWYLYLKAQIVRLMGDRGKALPLMERAFQVAQATKAPQRVVGPIQETLHRWKTSGMNGSGNGRR